MSTPFGAIHQAEEGIKEVTEAAKDVVEKIAGTQKTDASTPTDTSSDLENEKDPAEEVTQLAKQLTHQSAHSDKEDYSNPFAGSDDPELNPQSGKFRPERWVRNLIGIQSRDPERYPQRVAGVSYKNLNVHGFGSLTDYQK